MELVDTNCRGADFCLLDMIYSNNKSVSMLA